MVSLAALVAAPPMALPATAPAASAELSDAEPTGVRPSEGAIGGSSFTVGMCVPTAPAAGGCTVHKRICTTDAQGSRVSRPSLLHVGMAGKAGIAKTAFENSLETRIFGHGSKAYRRLAPGHMEARPMLTAPGDFVQPVGDHCR